VCRRDKRTGRWGMHYEARRVIPHETAESASVCTDLRGPRSNVATVRCNTKPGDWGTAGSGVPCRGWTAMLMLPKTARMSCACCL
jgi:hypothetical protein